MIVPILVFIFILICFISYQFYIAPLVDENEKLFDYNNHLLDELYNRSGDGTLVDNAWTCGCGQLNAAYNKECGKCKTIKPTGKWER
jgi:hypothetical protein